jgi:glycosyltransferase involved in cell wall biosynthesis
MPEKKRVLFLVPYPLRFAPSQRFRVELFLPHLTAQGIQYKVAPFLDATTFSILYSKASFLKKGWGVLKGFLKRLWAVLFIAPGYDYIFIHREASPLGPPVFEFILSKIFRKKVIYDFDDAIWIPDSTSRLLNWLKAFWKIKWICKWSYKVTAGNDYLCNYAKQYNARVVLIPTCVDVERKHNRLKDQYEEPLTVGWTGSHSTLKYLEPLAPLLKDLAQEFSLKVLIICNQPPSFSFDGLEYIKWSEESEIEDLLRMNIGVMPLPLDAWSEGKCGFKLIQYLSLGIPAAASPVGVNKIIIGEENKQLLCDTQQEWREALLSLVKNPGLREKIGKKGREKIITSYSIQAYAGLFVSLFE